MRENAYSTVPVGDTRQMPFASPHTTTKLPLASRAIPTGPAPPRAAGATKTLCTPVAGSIWTMRRSGRDEDRAQRRDEEALRSESRPAEEMVSSGSPCFGSTRTNERAVSHSYALMITRSPAESVAARAHGGDARESGCDQHGCDGRRAEGGRERVLAGMGQTS